MTNAQTDTDYTPARDGYDLPELTERNVFPDELKIGDLIGGLEITQLSAAEHYKSRAVRVTLETDPELHEVQQEVGRLVLITDRARCHRIPIMRPVED